MPDYFHKGICKLSWEYHENVKNKTTYKNANNAKEIRDPTPLLNPHQKLMDFSLLHTPPFRQVSFKTISSFGVILTDKQK